MSKLKKTLLMCTTYVLVAALAISGTIAYLQDTDSDVNVMTLGDVYIEQIEQQRVDDNANEHVLEKFENDKPLYPAYFEGTSIPWAPESEWVNAGEQAWKVVADNENVIDKFVTVKNTGKSNAFIRTIVAYEGDKTYGPLGDYIHIVTNGTNVTPQISCDWLDEVIEIDGVKYSVAVYTYPEALAAGETSIPSLKQVYMNKAATNEVVAQYGETYDILVISQAVQAAGFADAKTALNEAFGDPMAANGAGAAAAAEWMGGAIEAYQNSFPDVWDGTSDTTWYNDTDTTFALTTAEQLAGLADLVDGGNTFDGKTIVLAKDMDFYCEDANGEPLCFDPIGSYRKDLIFEGTFDGQKHTIKNMNQNTWALNNGYYYGDLGLGLFGAVENATIKNLVMDSTNISGESALCGTIAAVAGDNVTFENIKVTNCNIADYQYYAGGIVGWAGGDEQFINCVIDASTTIGGQWGDFNNANGGVIGGVYTKAEILIKDSTVACRIDAFNDVTSAYEWYSYRRSGMLIGDSGQKYDPDGDSVGNAIAPNLTCENVTVIYGDWANYHYCKFNAMDYPWVRVEAGISNGVYSNPRYGHPTDANGNTVVDENHVHNSGEAHNELIVFDQLYGGATGDRYCTYGTATHDGVTVIYNNK